MEFLLVLLLFVYLCCQKKCAGEDVCEGFLPASTSDLQMVDPIILINPMGTNGKKYPENEFQAEANWEKSKLKISIKITKEEKAMHFAFDKDMLWMRQSVSVELIDLKTKQKAIVTLLASLNYNFEVYEKAMVFRAKLHNKRFGRTDVFFPDIFFLSTADFCGHIAIQAKFVTLDMELARTKEMNSVCNILAAALGTLKDLSRSGLDILSEAFSLHTIGIQTYKKEAVTAYRCIVAAEMLTLTEQTQPKSYKKLLFQRFERLVKEKLEQVNPSLVPQIPSFWQKTHSESGPVESDGLRGRLRSLRKITKRSRTM